MKPFLSAAPNHAADRSLRGGVVIKEIVPSVRTDYRDFFDCQTRRNDFGDQTLLQPQRRATTNYRVFREETIVLDRQDQCGLRYDLHQSCWSRNRSKISSSSRFARSRCARLTSTAPTTSPLLSMSTSVMCSLADVSSLGRRRIENISARCARSQYCWIASTSNRLPQASIKH